MVAASAVFAIPELLENILVHVPEHDLLLAQCVNTFFRDIITTSSHLQRKLFFKADTVVEDGQVPELTWNPFFEVFKPGKGQDYPVPRLPRSIEMFLSHYQWELANVGAVMTFSEFIALSSIQLDLKALNNVDYPSASWKRMFFTQPALCAMQMRNILLCRQAYDFYPFRTLKDSGGIKMGQLTQTCWQYPPVASMDFSIISGFARPGISGAWVPLLRSP